MPAPQTLPAYPLPGEGRLISRLTFFQASAPVAVPASGWFSGSALAGIVVGILSQQALRFISLDLQLQASPSNLPNGLIVHGLGLELDGPKVTLKTWPSPATANGKFGILNLHVSESDLLYWNDFAANGGVMPSVELFDDTVVENTDAVNPWSFLVNLAAIIELYDYSLA